MKPKKRSARGGGALGAAFVAFVTACGGREYGPPDPTPPNPACARAVPERMRIKAMLAAGRLDRSLRIMQLIEGTCPEEAELTWADHVAALAAVGRTSEARQLARVIEVSSRATDVDRNAATAALEASAAYERKPEHAEAAKEQARETLHKALAAAAQGKHADAKRLALESWSTSHPNARALVEAGLAAYELGEHAEAQRLWDRAVFDDTNAPIRPQVGARPPFDARGNAVAISARGDRVATSGGSFVNVYDGGLSARVLLSAGADLVTAVGIAVDGTELYVGLLSGRVRAFDLLTSETSRELLGPTQGAVVSVAPSPDGKKLAVGREDGTIALVDVASGGSGKIARVKAASLAVRKGGELKLTVGATGAPVRLAWSPDAIYVAWADDLGAVGVVEAAKAKPMGLAAPGGVALGVGFGAARALDVFTSDRHLRYDLSHGAASPTEIERGLGVRAAGTSGAAIAVVQGARARSFPSSDARIGTPDGADASRPRAHAPLDSGDDGLKIAVTPDGASAVFLSRRSLRVQHPDGSVVELKKPAGLESVSATASGNALAIGASDGSVHVIPLPTGKIVITRAPGPNARVALSPDGAQLAVGAATGGVAIIDRTTGAATAHVATDGAVLSLAFSADGQHLAIGGKAARVRIANAKTGAQERDLDLEAGDVVGLAFSPGGGKLISSSAAGLTLWDVVAGRGERLPGFAEATRAVAWSPDRASFVVAGADGTLSLGAPGKQAPTKVGHLLGAAIDVTFATGAVVVAEQDGSVTFRGSPEKIQRRFRVPGAAARALAPLPGGVAAAMSDGSVRVFLPQKDHEVVTLWPVAKGAVATSPSGHVELLGEARHTVVCRLGPVAYPWEVCAEPFRVEGLVAVALAGRDPAEADR